MSELILQGPFLTRAEAARRSGVPSQLVVHRPDLLKVGGSWLQEVYFRFQFDHGGVRPDLGRVVQSLRPQRADVVIGDWLVRPNDSFGHASPLRYLKGGGSVERVVEVGEREVPTVTSPRLAEQLEPEPQPAHRQASPTRPRRRPAGSRRPALGSH